MEGKVAIVTGGASGIGEAITRLFIAEGARVVVADILDDPGEGLVEELKPNALYRHADVSSEEDIQNLVDYACREFGPLDCMINNAGISGVVAPIDAIPVEGFDRTMAVDLRAIFLGMKHAVRVMRPRGTGSIISTASVAGLQTGHADHTYSAAKAAVIHLTRSVAMEAGEIGIRVNCICPGWIATPILGKSAGLTQEDAEKSLASVSEVLTGFQPLKRAGLPEDVARAALWLAGDESSFVNGHALVVDGGISNGRMWTQFFVETAPLASAMGLG
ncbi:MAG: glucose 1-dehydrogenase [Dehalococcoidia bacterium]